MSQMPERDRARFSVHRLSAFWTPIFAAELSG
jgi:hypothetical protein